MSLTPYRSNFYLKGGALIYAYEHFSARPTLDVDFLGNNISNDSKKIVAVFKEICTVPCEEDGVLFDITRITHQHITEFKDYHGVRLSIPVSMDTITQVLTLDIGFGDVVTPEAIELDYPVLLEHLPFANILAYSIETVIAEKMHAIIDLADQSSRMKDYYDLYQILTTKQYDVEILKEAVQRTFENRHTKYKDDTAFFRTEYPNSLEMQVRWKAFIHKIASDTDLSFTDVAYYLQIQLRPYWNNLRHKR